MRRGALDDVSALPASPRGRRARRPAGEIPGFAARPVRALGRSAPARTAGVERIRSRSVQSVLIVNPQASKVTEPLVEQVARTLGVADVLRTERGGHATELVAGLGGAERIYVFSGDGGFNEALNGSDGSVPLGFVPGGGTSVLPRALGLPRDPVEAARRLAAGNTRRISLGRANGRRFGFAAGVGLDAELVRRMDDRGRDETGRRPGRSRLRLDGREDACREPAPLRAGARDRGARTRRVRARRQRGSLQLRRPVAAPAPARRPDRRGPRPPRAALLPGALAPGGRQLHPHRPHPARRSCTSTTPTGSRSAAMCRCRCSSTERTSATSRRSCSRRSGTPSPSSSESRQ